MFRMNLSHYFSGVAQEILLRIVNVLGLKSEAEFLRVHLAETPERMGRMYADELLKGYSQKPEEILKTDFPNEKYDQFVVVKDIDFSSLCSHHMLPFIGKAHVAYLPDGRVVGLSKIPRLVECYSRRLQIQEALTEQIASALMEFMSPKGVAVVIEAEHLCMTIRGAQKPGTKMITSCLLGSCRDELAQREEVFALMGVR